jgi:uncharacterized protein YggE
MRKAIAILLAVCGIAAAQTARRPFVRAYGEGTVSVNPDQAKVQFGVVTQAPTAQAASSQNATQVTSLLAALRSLLGATAEIKTLSYSLNPTYNYPRDGGQPTLIGYTATNIVGVTITDIAIVGKVIDTGIQAGGNRVHGIQFGLKDDNAARQQALKLATAQAKADADAIASGLNMKTGAAVAIEEGVQARPFPVDARAMAMTAEATPIESGPLEIRANVTLEVELLQ